MAQPEAKHTKAKASRVAYLVIIVSSIAHWTKDCLNNGMHWTEPCPFWHAVQRRNAAIGVLKTGRRRENVKGATCKKEKDATMGQMKGKLFDDDSRR